MIVSVEKVLAGSGMGPVGEDSAAPRHGANDPDAGWKGDRLGVRLKERTGEPARSPKIISVFPRHPPFEGLLKPAFISQRKSGVEREPR